MQPLIIFGTRGRETSEGKGKFYCPNCSVTRDDERVYERKKRRNYFSIYFVPLVPLGSGDEYVVCQNCGTAFAPDIVDANFTPKRRIAPLAQQLNTLKQRLEEGTPVEYAVADLTAAGLERNVAQENVRQVIGQQRRACPDCGLTYAASVERCVEDNTPLSEVR